MSSQADYNILVFDSGLGGLSLIPEIRKAHGDWSIIYLADNALFPYGDLSEDELSSRLVDIFRQILNLHDISTAVIACNTASTATLDVLRAEFSIPFVGTVPAIKPACSLSKTGLVSVLATPGTVSRDYTQKLIEDFAGHVDVCLHGSTQLASLAEDKLSGREVDIEQVRLEIEPAFQQSGKRHTDIIVLGCTHYPLLKDEMIKAAPWPVQFLDTSEAIARRLRDVCSPPQGARSKGQNRLILTKSDAHMQSVFDRYGFAQSGLLSV